MRKLLRRHVSSCPHYRRTATSDNRTRSQWGQQRLSCVCTLLRRKELALKAREKRKAEQLGIDPELLDDPPGDEQQPE